MDAMHGSLVPLFVVSLTVLSTVLSRHGSKVVLDAGRKSIGVDFASPQLVGRTATPTFFAEEHAQLEASDGCVLKVGDLVHLVAGYAPTTVNLHDVAFGYRGDKIVKAYPLFPRGPGHRGFAQSLARS